jgi:hypothetical protein
LSLNPPPLRRLPGVFFEAPTQAPEATLVRMDIAFFVGFAGSGPLGAAVVVESLAEFETVFGGPLALVVEAQSGAPVTGQLHAGVRAFFSQGGLRCWVLRVAGAGLRTRRLPLPALLRLRRGQPGAQCTFKPASLPARSPGSGADTLRVAARLIATALRAKALDSRTLQLDSPLALRPGDLLRITFGPVRMHLRVTAVDGLRVSIDGRVALRPLLARPDLEEVAKHPAIGAVWLADGRLAARVRMRVQDLPQPGQTLALGFQQRRAWMALDEVEITEAPGPDGRLEVRLTGQPWRLSLRTAQKAYAAWRASGQDAPLQLLRLDLRTRNASGQQNLLQDLSLASADDMLATGVFALPNDEQVFASQATDARFARRDPLGHLSSRFDLASDPLSGIGMLLPLADLDDFGTDLQPLASGLSALQRDGLADFDWSLFAEPTLAQVSADLLADRAEVLRNTGHQPAPLHGIHAALGGHPAHFSVEPTLLVVPDAIHPGWQPIPEPTSPWTELAPLPEPPDPCATHAFRDCAATPLPRPRLVRGPDPLSDGSFTLYWTQGSEGAEFTLEEALDPGFGSAVTLYRGQPARFDAPARKPGEAFYRVSARLGQRQSPWSAPVHIVIGAQGYQTRPWQPENLLAIHRLMLRCAAARGDMLALLALPMAFNTEQATHYAASLGSPRSALLTDAAAPPVIGADEGRALSHGALFHPWLMIRRDTDEIWFPPDGAICGQLAAGALTRGAWIAVANRPLRDCVGLSPPGMRPTLSQRQQLLDAQVNLLRSAPSGFVVSSSDTLARETDWRPINVRRLMCLLRRLALQLGVTYVFEPNGAVLRRTVERGFEALLDRLYRQGALAGATPGQAYQVEVGESLNTRQRREAGQFWVELKVAPALPMSFLTVRLARQGERLLSQETH